MSIQSANQTMPISHIIGNNGKSATNAKDHYSLNDIVYVRAYDDACLLVLKCGQINIIHKPFPELLNLLKDEGFFHVFSSYLVNLSYLRTGIENFKGQLILPGGQSVCSMNSESSTIRLKELIEF